MEKKNIAIILLAVGLGASGVGNLLLAVQLGFVELEEEDLGDILLFGDTVGPDDLDPHTCFDTGGSNTIEQVCEGLLAFNLTDPEYKLIPRLATAMPTIHGLELSFSLRTGVTFHDGTAFNASVAKWNFDRLNHFLNYSGNDYLPAPFNKSLAAGIGICQFATLITVAKPAGVPRPPIINKTEVVGPYTLNITLNTPKASFINLFAFSGLFMLSPASTPANDYVQVHEKIIGTGPFIYDYYVGDVELSLLANENYWQGAPRLDGVKYIYFSSDTTMNEAMLAGDIDITDGPNPTYLDAFEDHPDITLIRGTGGLNTNFMVFNCDIVNVTWREAMSFAVNYSYIIDIDWLGQVFRLKSPIPQGVPFSNYEYGAVWNLTRARLVVQSMGFGTGLALDDDAAWTAVADGGSPFFEIDMKVDSEDTDAINQVTTMAYNFRYIGVDGDVDATLTFDDIVDLIFSPTHDGLELFNIGWKPDYLDPENYVEFFFDSTSSGNINYSNPVIDALLAQGAVELNITAREAIYDDIQRIIAGEDYPHIFISTPRNNDCFRNEVKGWIWNSIGSHWFYSIYFE